MSRSSFSPAAAALFVLLTISWPGGAPAGGREPFEPIDAEALIDACWAISREDRDSGVTAGMRSGTARTAECLENVVYDQARAMFDLKRHPLREIRERIALIREGYQKFYWSLYNEHKMCRLWCGTDKHVYHISYYAKLLEEIVRDMVSERNEVGF